MGLLWASRGAVRVYVVYVPLDLRARKFPAIFPEHAEGRICHGSMDAFGSRARCALRRELAGCRP
jgi:hypothetical protein